jgi:hypothetical protein
MRSLLEPLQLLKSPPFAVAADDAETAGDRLSTH